MGRNQSDASTDSKRSRRRFMKTLGAVGVAGIAGCGGDGDGTPTDTEPPGETSTDTEPPGETPTSTEAQPIEDPIQLLELGGGSAGPGGTTTLSGSANNPYLYSLRNVVFTLSGPDDWTISTPEKQFDSIDTGSSVDVSWEVTAPDSASGSTEFTLTTSYETTSDSAELTQTVDVLVFEPGNVPGDGLEAYYPLDGSATNAVTGTDATVAGEPATDAEGVVNGAFEFTETGDRSSVADALVTEDLPLNGEGATVGAWVNVTGHEPYSKLFQIGGSLDGLPPNGWDIEFNDTADSAWIVTWTDEEAVRAEATETSLSTDTWYFIVAVVDGDDARLHVFDQSGEIDDSPKSGSGDRAQTDAVPLHLMAGAGDDTAGRLDEVRAYSRALSEEEVTALYGGSSASSE